MSLHIGSVVSKRNKDLNLQARPVEQSSQSSRTRMVPFSDDRRAGVHEGSQSCPESQALSCHRGTFGCFAKDLYSSEIVSVTALSEMPDLSSLE